LGECKLSYAYADVDGDGYGIAYAYGNGYADGAGMDRCACCSQPVQQHFSHGEHQPGGWV
jgi:hypothetical protein